MTMVVRFSLVSNTRSGIQGLRPLNALLLSNSSPINPQWGISSCPSQAPAPATASSSHSSYLCSSCIHSLPFLPCSAEFFTSIQIQLISHAGGHLDGPGSQGPQCHQLPAQMTIGCTSSSLSICSWILVFVTSPAREEPLLSHCLVHLQHQPQNGWYSCLQQHMA